MRPHKNRYEPPSDLLDYMVRRRFEGATYAEIADEIGEPKDRVVQWLLFYAGKTIGARPGGYHSRKAVHKRYGVYFDATSLAGLLKGENG